MQNTFMVGLVNILLDASTVQYFDVRTVKDIALSDLANERFSGRDPFLELPGRGDGRHILG
jgi:hypothetical protein